MMKTNKKHGYHSHKHMSVRTRKMIGPLIVTGIGILLISVAIAVSNVYATRLIDVITDQYTAAAEYLVYREHDVLWQLGATGTIDDMQTEQINDRLLNLRRILGVISVNLFVKDNDTSEYKMRMSSYFADRYNTTINKYNGSIAHVTSLGNMVTRIAAFDEHRLFKCDDEMDIPHYHYARYLCDNVVMVFSIPSFYVYEIYWFITIMICEMLFFFAVTFMVFRLIM